MMPLASESGLRVAVDGRRLLGVQTGVARYQRAVLGRWSRCVPDGVAVVEVHAPGSVDFDGIAATPWLERRDVPSRLPPLAWENMVLPARVRGADALWCPTFTVPLLRRTPPTVLVMFDALQALRAADFGRRGRYVDLPLMRASVRRADLVFTISEKAAADVQRAFGVRDDRLVVVLPGVDTDRFRRRPPGDPDGLRVRLGLGAEPLLLFVGKHSRRRHVPEIITAAGLARARGLPHRLVLVGPNQLGLPLGDLAREAGALVTHLEGIDDATLVDLYNLADVFVQLPEDEPFSLPLLEAMACGTPAITLDGPAIREIGGDAVCYLPAVDATALAETILALVGDAERRAHLGAAGTERAARFSWGCVADALAIGLRYVAGAGPRPARRPLGGGW